MAAPKAKLQALVLADSFDRKYTPISSETPRALMPLVNVPMIEYTLEFLVAGGMQEIYVYCCAHSDKIEAYLKGGKWRLAQSSMGVKVQVVHGSPDQVSSFGDALRDIEARHILEKDFLLVCSDVVSNVSVQRVIQEHNKRRDTDKASVLTMVMKKAKPLHAAKSMEDDLVVTTVQGTNQLVAYSNARKAPSISIDTAIFEEYSALNIRYDLLDPCIYMCTQEVLVNFQDNFDYKDMEDFLENVLQSDILGYKVFVDVVTTEYAARAKDLRTYDSVSKHVIRRWVDPVTPDNNILSDTTYSITRNGVFREDDVDCDRTAQIGSCSVLGKGVRVGAGSQIINSVIGRNVVIGKNVVLQDCYIWDATVIEDNVTATKAIVATHATIKQGASLEKGVILSHRVVIGANVKIPAYTRISTLRVPVEAEVGEDSDEDFSDEEIDSDEADLKEADSQFELVGSDGRGVKTNLKDNLTNTIAPAAEQFVDAPDSDDEEEMDPEELMSPDERWMDEMDRTIKRALDGNINNDNLLLEIRSLKLTHNRDFADCVMALVPPLLSSVALDKSFLGAFKKMLSQREQVFKAFAKHRADQIELINVITEYCETHDAFAAQFQNVLKLMYDQDILEEDSLLKWRSAIVSDPEEDQTFVLKAKQFLDWLEEAESEDSDSD